MSRLSLFNPNFKIGTVNPYRPRDDNIPLASASLQGRGAAGRTNNQESAEPDDKADDLSVTKQCNSIDIIPGRWSPRLSREPYLSGLTTDP